MTTLANTMDYYFLGRCVDGDDCGDRDGNGVGYGLCAGFSTGCGYGDGNLVSGEGFGDENGGGKGFPIKQNKDPG